MSTKGVTRRGFTVTVNRNAAIIKWISITLIVASILLIFRQLPFGSAVQAMEDWIGDLGIWGPVVFALLYVIAVVLLVPASALTLAAGALFGLVGGTIIVSLASTTGAALSFLISRYLARNRIAKKVEQYPKFDAIDKAISGGGWKIVALLRLSPAIPFGMQNYLYGVTGIRFWTCVLTSWVAMLPGTFMYVYLGHVGRAGLDATAGGAQSKGPTEWAMMIVGLLATIAVTVYVTRLARKALKDQTDFAKPSEPTETNLSQPIEPKSWPWSVTIAALIALAAMSAAASVHFNPELLRQWLGSSLGPTQRRPSGGIRGETQRPDFRPFEVGRTAEVSRRSARLGRLPWIETGRSPARLLHQSSGQRPLRRHGPKRKARALAQRLQRFHAPPDSGLLPGRIHQKHSE